MKLYQRARRKRIKDLHRDEITLRIDGIEERVYLLERRVGDEKLDENPGDCDYQEKDYRDPIR
jgi:hypothetical protein